MQWKNFDCSYRPTKVQFSESNVLVKSLRSALEAFRPYFDTSVTDETVTKTNRYAAKFIDTQGLTKTTFLHSELQG
jgi:hypothetical protein